MLLLVVGASACSYTPVTAELAPPPLAQSTRIYAADGSLITQLHAEENRENVSLDELPGHLVDAVLAIEDARYWDHKGVDLKAILRAAVTNASEGDVVEGGSTITQQFVKTVLLDPERTLDRKAHEAILAIQLERRYTKERILELYLNTIYFGAGAYGVQAASQTYFGVPASEIDLPQAAMLAGLVHAPGVLDPFDAPDLVEARRGVVLDRMAALGLIGDDDAAAAAGTPLGVAAKDPRNRYAAPHFVERVKRFVLDDPRFGATAAERRALLFGGGLRITTTLDLRTQYLAELAVDAVRPPAPGPDAALVAIEPATGDVHALVGGRDFYGGGERAKLDLATGGPGRPAGSSFKPLVLAAALEAGIGLDSVYPAPGRLRIPLASGHWDVANYEGGGGGHATLHEATVRSYNTVYAQLIQDVGPEAAVEMAARLGVTAPLQPYPSAVLGTNDVHPIDMAAAYATIANRGVRVDPVFVTRILRDDGSLLYTHEHRQERAVTARVADQVTAVLQDAVARGTGTRAQLRNRPAAGKTGTGQEWRDAWFVGFTPQLATAVWMGFADAGRTSMVPPTTPMRVTGGSWPAQIWQRFMEAALDGRPVETFVAPDEVVTAVLVRSVVGLTAPRAAALLAADGLVVEQLEVVDDQYPPGVVVAQSPPGGRLPRGARVVLSVAVGRQVTVDVPDLIGLSPEEAVARLEQLGLVADLVPTATDLPTGPAANPGGDPAEPAGSVVVTRQAPDPFTRQDPGGSVTIWVEPATSG